MIFGHPIPWWTIFGLVFMNGMFMGRNLVQWYASEKKKETVVPVSFWWMSIVGAVAGVVYCAHLNQKPLVIGFAVTMIPYVRNLVIHYRPDRSPRPLTLIVPVAILLGIVTLLAKFIIKDDSGVVGFWLWWSIIATVIFYSRFFVQWIQSEKHRKSVMPMSFWIQSFVGAFMLLIFSFYLLKLPLILSFLFNVIPYTRNIMIILKRARQANGPAAA